MSAPSHKTSKDALNVESLSVTLNGTAILEDISFTVKRGSITAIVGPNGSGKTTLIKTILGISPKTTGTISLFGQSLHDVRGSLGYVPQRFEFDKHFPLTVEEFLHLARHPHAPRSRVLEKVKEVGLTPQVLSVRLGKLSGGQLQRVLIAQAILNNPSLLVLDEPATGIDIVGEEAFYDVLQHLNEEHETTILLVSHDISMVLEHVDQVICINKTLLCSGPPKRALSKSNIKKLFGEERSQHHHSHKHRPS